MSTNGKDETKQVVGFVGVGLDNRDDHQRITRSEQFLLVGGSKETHEMMQDTAMKFEEALRNRGKTLQDTSLKEAVDLLVRAMDS